MRLGRMLGAVVSVCISALMLCGCDTPKSGKPGAADQSGPGKMGLSFTPSIESEEQKEEPTSFSAGKGLIYDRCGFRLVITDNVLENAQLNLRGENTTDKKLILRSVYIQEGDMLSASAQSLKMTVNGGESKDATLSLPKSKGSLKMKLYLLDEGRNYVEGSLSETITVTAYQKKVLHQAYTGIPVYEDDKLKLTYTGATYRNDSDTVKLGLYAVNKTDKDIYIGSWKAECVHEDFYFSFKGYIPANSEAEIKATATTLNRTIGAGALDSVSFDLRVFDCDDIVKVGTSANELFMVEGLNIKLAEAGKPEKVIPDTVTEAESLEEVLVDLDYSSYAVLPDTIEGSTINSSANGIDAVFLGGLEGAVDGSGEGILIFKVTNNLQKPIAIEAEGTINGMTADLGCYDSVDAMKIKYLPVYFDMADTDTFGKFADCKVKFIIRYDDGHRYDGESVICTLPEMSFNVRERKDVTEAINKFPILYSDENCDVRVVGYNSGDSIAFCFCALNKTDRRLKVDIEPERTDLHIYESIDLLPETYAVKTVTVYVSKETDKSTIDIGTLKLNCNIYFADE